MLRRVLCALSAVPLLLAASCASPTLPLPPPEQPTIGPGADADHVVLADPCGGADASSILVVVNTNPSVANGNAVTGTRATACGSWQVAVWAHKGDTLQITQQSGNEVSSSLDVLVP